ncbi:MAG: ABC transporter ATP-binding protein [Bacteroidales bacterium]|nr:MAG: ABC transporter ATP-binding protein [Bacteroidales bacterium]
MKDSYLEIISLSKSFRDTRALSDINIKIPEKCLFGIIGPDGAGKTTLLRIITTLMLPDTGSVRIKDMDIIRNYKKVRSFTGYMPGRFSLYQDLTVEENLEFYATIFGTTLQKNYNLIRDVYSHIEPFKKRLTRNLSGGMKQKLALSCALIHNPELLVLDEPTTGVDAVSRDEFWGVLKRLRDNGMTIIVSTPYMNEAGLCDYVALMHDGRLIETDIPDRIVERFNKSLLAIKSDNINKLVNDLRGYSSDSSAYLFGHEVHYYQEKKFSITDIENYLKRKGHEKIEIKGVRANIEDCFITAIEDYGDIA